MNKLFSILIFPCDQEEKLIECLNNIYKQKFYNCEIFVILNKKSRLSKITEHMRTDYDMKFVFAENQEMERVKKDTLKSCRGRYILFMQKDEFYSEDYLHECCKKALISKNKLICTDKNMNELFGKVYDGDLIRRNITEFDKLNYFKSDFNQLYRKLSQGIVYCEKTVCRKNY